MTWLLDTNVLSETIRPKPADQVIDWIDAQPVASLYTLSLALAEIWSGIERLQNLVRRSELEHWLNLSVRPMFAGRVIDADEAVWLAMLRIQANTKAANRTVPWLDLVFAASAERHGLIIVTRNVKDFAGTGVRVLNPWLPDPEVSVV